VVVFGAGPIGILAAMICREAFCARVEVVEPLPMRRELVRAWCDRAYEVEEFFASDAGEPIDVVIEASGEARNLDRVIERLGPRASVALLARTGQPLHVEHADHLITRGIGIVGSRGHLGGAFEEVLRLYRAGRLPLHAAVTGVAAGLNGVHQALQTDGTFEQRHAKLLARLDLRQRVLPQPRATETAPRNAAARR
jgi:threonine dehydrogenase-like Zn-dependent dehydrogenase